MRVQRNVSAFVRVCECERRMIKINAGKSKMMKMLDMGEKDNLGIEGKEEVMEEVDTFQYLGVEFASNENEWRIESQEYGGKKMCRCAQECILCIVE